MAESEEAGSEKRLGGGRRWWREDEELPWEPWFCGEKRAGGRKERAGEVGLEAEPHPPQTEPGAEEVEMDLTGMDMRLR